MNSAPASAGHVGLDALLLAGEASYRSAGIHHYMRALLAELPAADPGLRYTAFVGPRAALPDADLRWARTAWPTHRPAVRVLWEQAVLPWLAVRQRIDLLHALAFVSPVWLPCPSVVTVYDLSFDVTPQRVPAARRGYLSTLTRLSCRRARRVIAISEHTRAEVSRRYGIPMERIDVAAPGVDPAARPLPRAEVESFRRRRGLPDRFVFCLATLEPRKGLPTLIRAFAQLRMPDVRLVLAGGKGWGTRAVIEQIEALNLGDRVSLPGYLPADELPLWYNAAEVFVYPSTYEGFGIPPAEALACGAPVIVSDAASLPEVVGDAGVRVPPGDERALADALRRLLSDAAERQSLASRGPGQAGRFTWAKTAAATAAAYRRALAPAGVK